jgi:hypothetical protein
LIGAVTHHSRFCQALYFFHPNIGRAENQREPRASRILIAVDCHHYTTPLKLEFAQAFLAFSSELRVAGNCYFVSNSESETVAKLLASRKRQWETGITPEQINNVNRLMYEFQNTFKDFKAKN